MTEVVLYHHVQGLTEGVQSFAEELRQAGHIVHTPDLFDGRTFDTIEEGMAFAREAGFGPLAERGLAAAKGIRPDVVYAGFSFGVPAPAEPCSSTHASQSPSSGTHGRKAYPSRCTARTPTRSSPKTSKPHRRSSTRPTEPNCSSTPEKNTSSPTLRSRPTTPSPQHCSPSACSHSSTHFKPTRRTEDPHRPGTCHC